ncbi:hypothetical protein AYK26_06350 [Euryarchaeota archaeon SM23-78]|nr:MAG: hypothetical protein AYK26_06350 [Euryarchaeota archaeon SM23-78]MBW3001056.1 hypothetical protein [Candidatus Woesearchaeota archaeon]
MASQLPYSSAFMLSSILGFIISVFFVMDYSLSWGFTFALVFLIMFISSVISMSQIEAHDKYGLQELAIHEQMHGRKKKKRKKKK